MQLLKDRIISDGVVKNGKVLKVDSFLNHQIDVELADAMGAEFKRLFADAGITKILTIEASGIGIACITALHFGVPVVFAKKSLSMNLGNELLFTTVHSFTHDCDFNVLVTKAYIKPDDKVLIIDDFLANGAACDGLMDLVRQAGATVAGIGICVEKGFQGGGDALREKGIRVESLAIVESMDPDTKQIVFRDDH